MKKAGCYIWLFVWNKLKKMSCFSDTSEADIGDGV